MSERHSTGTLNPAFDIHYESSEVKEEENVEPDVQITRFGGRPDDFSNEKVSSTTNTSLKVPSEATLITPSESSDGTEQAKYDDKTSDITDGLTHGVLQDSVQDEVQITRFGGEISDSNEKLGKRNTYTVSKKDDNKAKENLRPVLPNHKEQTEDENKIKKLEDATGGQRNTEDIRIDISEDVDNTKMLGTTQSLKASMSNPLNGKFLKDRSKMPHGRLAQSLRLSLSKAAKTPPLDANYLRGTLRFTEEQIKGRNLLYMKMGPMTDEDTEWLAWVEVKFKEIVGEKKGIDLEAFKKALGVKRPFFAKRCFELLDQDGKGHIPLPYLMEGLRMLTKGTPAQKLQFLFDVYDADASGTIERDEFMAVLRACMEESSLSLTEDNLEDLTDVLFDAADEDESGSITFEGFRAELEKHPGVIENLTLSASQWLKPPDKSKRQKSRFKYLTLEYWRNNYRKVGYFLIYWAVNITLYAVAMWQYRESNIWVMVARGAGFCLNFNCMWVLVLMLRKSLTFLRMTKLVHVLPLDQHILFHKMTAWTIAGLAFVHTMAHVGNSAYMANANAIEMWEVLFTAKAAVGYVYGSAYITGWLLVIVLTIMVTCSLPFVRRSGHFEVFYWTHMLYVPFWILVILHGPNFWKWFIGPGVLFIMEKVSRSKIIKMVRYGDTYIEEVNLLPSGVTHLVISRPTNFRYKPGDYIFIQIPEIASYEWHPFTISSAPEMEGHIWLHVRSAGHWTNTLYKYFDNLEAPEDAVDEKALISRDRRTTSRKFEKFERAYSRRATLINKSSKVPSRRGTTSRRSQKPKQKHKVVKVKCFVDGPYGTGTREVFDTDHAVLVGAGIGVTPMASILQSVWYRFHAERQSCPKCEHVWYPDEDAYEMKLRKVDFIWINRDQRSFEWFLTLLNQIEFEQSSHRGVLEDCIQMHMYMTAAQKKTDMKGIGLQIALDLMYEKSQRDIITGLKTKTEPGRPDWNKIFKGIKAENKGKVKIFFCGAPALGQTIKEMSEKYNFAFSKENF